MKPPFKYYLEHMHTNWHYRAIWDPGRHLELGMIGKLDSSGSFTVYSSLKKEGIDFVAPPDTHPIDQDYTSNDSVEITAKVSGSAPAAGSVLSDVDAGFSINFKKQNGVVFKAQGQRTEEIINMDDIAKAVLQKYNNKNWDEEWLIITKLVSVDSATIIINNSSKCQLELRAKGKVGQGPLDLANAALDLSTASEKGSSMKFIGQSGMTPLYAVMGVRHPIWSKPGFVDKKAAEGAEQYQLKPQPFDPAELEN